MALAAYDDAVEIVRSGTPESRVKLASDPDTAPEFLYFLAEDPDVTVRGAVASNSATPQRANLLLSKDPDIPVRCLLARKLVGDGLPDDKRQELWRMGFTILETLLRDQVVQVRRILSDGFRSLTDAPRDVVLPLSVDEEESVAAPILRHSPVLTDDDLCQVIESSPPDWACDAIAARDCLSGPVGDSLLSHGTIASGAVVLEREDVRICPPVLEQAVEKSRTVTEWQAPLVSRPGLSAGLIETLASFIASALLSALKNRPDMTPALTQSVDRAIAARDDDKPATAQSTDQSAPDEPVNPDDPSLVAEPDGETPKEAAKRAQKLFRAGGLDDNAVAAALDTRQENFVIAALALRAGIGIGQVRRMVKSRSGRTMMALSWKAGHSARFGLDLQRSLARIPPPKILNARGGFDYPMDETEMKEQLSIFK